VKPITLEETVKYPITNETEDRFERSLRIMISNQNWYTRTNSMWLDSPVCQQDMEDMVKAAFARTGPLKHKGEVVCSHASLAAVELAEALKDAFEDEFEMLLEHPSTDLPMWLVQVIRDALDATPWRALAQNWTHGAEEGGES
jgi:hypothetical protein